MLKRLISLMLVLAMFLSFTACKRIDDDDSESSLSIVSSSTESEEMQDSSSKTSSSSEDNSISSNEESDDTKDVNSTQTGNTQSSFSITNQPQNTSVTAGETLTLTLTASGSGLSYQWYTSLSPSGEGAIKLEGQTSPSLSISTKDAFVQYYYCVVSKTGTTTQIKSNIVTASANGTGALAPIPAPLSDIPTITNQPLNASYFIDVTATALSVTATIPSGNGALSYQWFEGSPTISGTAISGETNSTYTPSTASQGSKSYYCVVTNTLADGTTHKVNSEAATINVNDDVSYQLWIKDVQVKDSNASNILGNSSVQFDSTTNTLTLNNASLSYYGLADNEHTIHSELPDALTIILSGSNTVENTGHISTGSHAILTTGDLIIKGNGSLEAIGSGGGDISGSGIRAVGTVTISDSANVTATGGHLDDDVLTPGGHGIYANKTIIISGSANVAATGGSGSSTGGHGIYTEKAVTISDSANVAATGGTGSSIGGHGIFAYEPVTILDTTTVMAKGGNSLINDNGGYGISSNGSINIGESIDYPFDGTLTALAGKNADMYFYNAFSINATTFFGDGIKYYTFSAESYWQEGGNASNLPTSHYIISGLHFGTSDPTLMP